MAGYFVESQCEASDMSDEDGFSELSQAEWDEAMRQSEACRAHAPAAAAVAPAAPDSAESQGSATQEERVERRHSGLGRLARAAAAASPAEALSLGEVPEFPAGLVDLSENLERQTTRVVFTINNPGIFVPVFDASKMSYMVWQRERGKQGTEHIQGYVRFTNKCRLRTALALLGGHAHVLLARGNEKQCRDYCTKEDTRVAAGEEHGTFDPEAGIKGRRTDLLQIAAKCAARVPLRQIAADHPMDWVRYHQGIESLHLVLAPEAPIQRDVTVQVLWGPSGTGKTHRVRTNSAFLRTGGIYVVKPGRDPWGRYQGQATILFDEFDWTKWEIFDMNQYLDKWETGLDCRFHDKSAAWTRVVICANSSPTTWWPNATLEVLLAIRRRLGHGCRHCVTRLQDTDYNSWFEGELPLPDFSPEDGRDVLHLHPRVQALSTRTSDAPQAAAAAADAVDYVLCPDSQPPSPTAPQ
uniref:ATP-dependent helicase Rep n=1 Tax=uncultured virus TaxID=340016 RepID=A0A1D8MJX7_9VIRU|nr:putative rep protein [uncultured virus]